MTVRPIVGLTLAGLVGAAVGGWLFGGVVVAGAGLLARWQRRRRSSAAQHRLRQSLPEALELLVLGADAGLTPHQIIELLQRSAPVDLRPAFAAVVHRMERGHPLADAIDELPRRIGPPAVAATDAIRIAQRHGAPLTEAMSVISAEAQRQRRARAEAAARRLPVLLSFPLVCCILPAFVLLAIAPAVLGALSSIRSTGW